MSPVDSLWYCSGGSIYARLQIVQWGGSSLVKELN